MSDERGGVGTVDGGKHGAAGPTRGQGRRAGLYGAADVLLFFVSILIFEGQDTAPRLSYKMLK